MSKPFTLLRLSFSHSISLTCGECFHEIVSRLKKSRLCIIELMLKYLQRQGEFFIEYHIFISYTAEKDTQRRSNPCYYLDINVTVDIG